MHSFENIPGLLSVVSEKREIAEIAHKKWLESVGRVDSAVRTEWNLSLDKLKNKQYLFVDPIHFGVQNCLSVRNTGNNFKYMRILEEQGDSFVLSSEFRLAFQFKGFQLKGLFGSEDVLNTYKENNPEFAKFLDDSSQYLFMVRYVKDRVPFDLFDNLYYFTLLKV